MRNAKPDISYYWKPLLGLCYQSWTRYDIRNVLDRYEWNYNPSTRSKQALYHELYLLVQESGLTKKDRKQDFPLRRPRVQRASIPADPYLVASPELARNQAQSGTTSQPVSATSVADSRGALDDAIFTAPLPTTGRAPPAECVICLETLNSQNTPNRNVTSSCSHASDVCYSCLATSISTQMDIKVWDQIDCLICGQRLDFQDVKAFADPAVFSRLDLSKRVCSSYLTHQIRYDGYKLEVYLSGGHFQRCRQPGCQFGQQCFPKEDNYIICAQCRGRTCITCDTIWHPSQTCAEVAARRADQGREETAAMQYLSTNVKLCPRCKVRGEKISGCDHMSCKTQF